MVIDGGVVEVAFDEDMVCEVVDESEVIDILAGRDGK
jgi:hypothetical protein